MKNTIATKIYNVNYPISLYTHTGKKEKPSNDNHLMLVDYNKPNSFGYACFIFKPIIVRDEDGDLIEKVTWGKPCTTTIDNIEKNYTKKLDFNDLSDGMKRVLVNYLHQCGEKYILDDFQKDITNGL